MKFLTDLDLGKVARLNNTLLEDASSSPATYYTVPNGSSASFVGLVCHYDGRIGYFGKPIAGATTWYNVATTVDVPTYITSNRLLVTNGSGVSITSPDFGITSNDLDVGIGGTKRKIVNLADPISDYDAANKRYVDSMSAGLRDFKNSCVMATTADVSGTFSSVPAQATISDALVASFDTTGVTAAIGMRVLVKDQTLPYKNGIYEITALNGYNSTYHLQRTLDANETGELTDGTVVFVEKGTTNASTTWVVAGSGSLPVLNQTSAGGEIYWVLFSQTGGWVGGAGLSLTGNTFSVNVDNVTTQIVSDVVVLKGSTSGNDFKVLITPTGGSTTVPQWGQINLSQGYVTGTLPVSLGGTGLNTSATAQGSILYTSAAGVWSTLAANSGGTTKQVIVLDKTANTLTSTDTTGTGNVVLQTAPTITTSLSTGSSTFTLLDSTATTVNAFGAATALTIASTATGAQTAALFNGSTNNQTINIGSGVTANTFTKTINLGVNGASGSITNINIGSTAGTDTITLNSNTIHSKVTQVIDGSGGLSVVNSADNTKKLRFSVAGVTTGTARTWTVQDLDGSVALSVNNLSFFASTTSAQLATLISDETGSGVLVFGTSPTITTSLIAGSSTMDVFNTTATTVNAYALVTTYNVGNSTTSAQTVSWFSSSTGTSNYTLGGGATANAATKTISIGTGGVSGSITNINLGSSVAGATGTVTVNLGFAVRDGASGFTIFNATTSSKRAQFDLSGITTSTTRTYTLADTTGTIAMLAFHRLDQFASTTSAQLASVISDETGSGVVVFGTSPTFITSVLTSSTSFDVFNTTATTVNAFGAATTLTIGNTATSAQTVTIGSASTGASTYNIGTGITSAATTKTINIGTAGASTSVTNLYFGSAVSGATGTAAFQNITLTATSPVFATSVITGSSSLDVFNTTATTVNEYGAATTYSLAHNATGAQTVNMFGGSTGASTYNFAGGATGAATTKTLNFGATGVSTSVTNINFGSAVAGAAGTSTFRTAVIVNDGNTGNFFSIANVADATKKVAFSASGLTTATIRTLTVQDLNGTIALLGNHLGQFASTTSAQLATTLSDETGSGFVVFSDSPVFTTAITTSSSAIAVFNSTATTVNAFGATVSMNFGSATAGQTITLFGSSTGVSTYNFGTGATGTGNTKTLNIGTGGAAGSTTNINIGSAIGGTVTFPGTVALPAMATKDSGFLIYNAADNTKFASFSCSTISTGTIRTYTFPDANGTLALTSNRLDQFAATTSAQLASNISDETGSGLLVFNNTPALITPKITTGLDDVNGNLILGFTATASAVNYLTMTNTATTAGLVKLGTTGTDANVSLQLEPKATTSTPSSWGTVTWKDNAANSSLQTLRLCRTWGLTLSTGAVDRGNNTISLGTSMTISHDFGTQDIHVMLTEVSTGAMVMTDWVKTSGQETRQITLSFKAAPTSGVYRIVVIG